MHDNAQRIHAKLTHLLYLETRSMARDDRKPDDHLLANN